MSKDLINDLRNKVGASAESIIAGGFNLERKGKNYKCPNKSAHKHGDNNPSFSWDYSNNQFYCFACGHILDIYNYYTEIEGKEFKEIMTEHNLLDDNNKPVKQNTVPKIKLDLSGLTELNQEQINYIKARGISENTIKVFDIKSSDGKLAFLYKKDNKVIGAKLRAVGKVDKSKRFGALAGSKEKNFFNQDNVKPEEHETLIITEGEFDCMVVWQCGYRNVVSVSDGVKSSKRLIESEKKYLDKFKSIILISDNDDAGAEMDKTFIDNLGYKVKLVDKTIINKSDKNNDINYEYLVNGENKIHNIIKSATLKIAGFRDLTAQPYTGIKDMGKKYIPTGIDAIDDQINDLESRRMTVVMGRPCEGKSTFVQQVILNAIDKKHRVCLVDGEHFQDDLINGLYMQLIGRERKYYNNVVDNKRVFKEPTQKALKAIQEWHKNKLCLYSKGEGELKSLEQLFEITRTIITHNKVDLLVLDNLMSLVDFDSANEVNLKQKAFMQKCHDTCMAYNIHVIVVCHTNKQAVANKKSDMYAASGSSDIPNIADNIINVVKLDDEEKEEQKCDGFLHLTKGRIKGAKNVSVKTYFDNETYSLLEIKEGEKPKYKKMDWEKYLDDSTIPVIGTEDTPW